MEEQAIYTFHIEDFDCADTFDCGQCFRWNYMPDKRAWHGIAMGRELYISQQGNDFSFYPCTRQEFESIWFDYFDLQRGYAAIKQQLAFDENVARGMAYAGGIHILQQEKFETLISFIISANNNIKRIKGIIERICEKTGDRAGSGFAFPTPEQLSALSIEDLQQLGAGYRARYIHETTRMVLDGFDLESLARLPYDDARKQLCTLCGVGPKVADCIMLFSMGFTRAFPTDTWVKKVLADMYSEYGEMSPAEFAAQRFGDNAGFAQQYLFHYMRNTNQRSTVAKGADKRNED